MDNPTTNLGISVANLGIYNLGRTNNPILSKARMNILFPNLVSVPCNNPPTVQTLDHMEHPTPEDLNLLVDPWPSNNPPSPPIQDRGGSLDKIVPVNLNTPLNRG